MSDSAVKLRNKESVLRFKNGSPKLKDVLRKKCKERWQKNREDFVDKLRNITEDVDVFSTLTDMIKEDLRTVYTSDVSSKTNIVNVENIEEETINEELEWLMSKYDDIFESEEFVMSMVEDLNQVICPICQKNPIELKPISFLRSAVTCRCGLSVPTTSDLCQIKENIMACLDEHNSTCNANPQFSVINEVGENHVFLMCYVCSSFHMLM